MQFGLSVASRNLSEKQNNLHRASYLLAEKHQSSQSQPDEYPVRFLLLTAIPNYIRDHPARLLFNSQTFVLFVNFVVVKFSNLNIRQFLPEQGTCQNSLSK